MELQEGKFKLEPEKGTKLPVCGFCQTVRDAIALSFDIDCFFSASAWFTHSALYLPSSQYAWIASACSWYPDHILKQSSKLRKETAN